MADDQVVDLIRWQQRALLIGMAFLSTFGLAACHTWWCGWSAGRIGGRWFGAVARGLLQLGFEIPHPRTQECTMSTSARKATCTSGGVCAQSVADTSGGVSSSIRGVCQIIGDQPRRQALNAYPLRCLGELQPSRRSSMLDLFNGFGCSFTNTQATIQPARVLLNRML